MTTAPEQALAAKPGPAQSRLARLDQRTTPDDVHQVLRAAILNGAYPPGSQLREAHLAADLGISRAPLREAFSRLEEEGLLVRVAFRGAFVAQVSPITVAEIAQLRFLVEPYASEQTAARLGSALPDHVQALVLALREAADAQDLSASIDAHLQFHRFFYQASGNEQLQCLWAGWEMRLRLFLAEDHRSYGDLDGLASAHECLASLIQAGHMERFRAELAHHVHKAPGASLDQAP